MNELSTSEYIIERDKIYKILDAYKPLILESVQLFNENGDFDKFGDVVELVFKGLSSEFADEKKLMTSVEYILANDVHLTDELRVILYSLKIYYTSEFNFPDPANLEGRFTDAEKSAWTGRFLANNDHLSQTEKLHFEAFSADRIRLKKVNGVDVIFVLDDHRNIDGKARDTTSSSVMKQLLDDPATPGIIMEYMPEELEENMDKNIIFKKMYAAFLGLSKGKSLRDYHESRIVSPRRLTDQAKESGKPIWVADTANKFSHELSASPLNISLWIGVTSLIVINEFTNLSTESQLTSIVLKQLMSTFWILEHFIKMDVFKSKKMSETTEKILLDPDDLRRIRVARAIDMLTKQQSPDSQIVVVYPEAHVNRILYYLDHLKLANWKEKIYKSLAFWLDYELRTFTYNEQDSKWKKEKESY